MLKRDTVEPGEATTSSQRLTISDDPDSEKAGLRGGSRLEDASCVKGSRPATTSAPPSRRVTAGPAAGAVDPGDAAGEAPLYGREVQALSA